jgi:hypothetical protein
LITGKTTLAVLREVLEDLDSSSCGFWACPGPGKRPVYMATCSKCWAAWDIRALIRREEKKA